MVKFTHYLVTRFNVPVDTWKTDKHGHSLLDDAWMVERLFLFSEYCLPSVNNQTEKNFEWIIYCDTRTPLWWIKRISDLMDIPGRFILKYVSSMAMLEEDLAFIVHESPTPFVITTRLDNDDAISRTFIQMVQAHFTPHEDHLINLENGYFFHPVNNVLTKLQIPSANNFISLISAAKTAGQRTIYSFPHTQIPDQINVIRVKQGAHWMRLVHDRNVRSELKGRPVWQNAMELIPLFNFKLKISWVHTLGYVLRRILTRH